MIIILSLTEGKAQNYSFIENRIKVPHSYTESSMKIGYANTLVSAINPQSKYLIISVFENIKKQEVKKYYVFDFKERSIVELDIDTVRYKPITFVNDTLFCENRIRKELLIYDFYKDSCKKLNVCDISKYAMLSSMEEQWIFNESQSFAFQKSKINSTDVACNQLLIRNRKLNINDTVNFDGPLIDNCYKCFWFAERKLLISSRFPDTHDFYSKLFIYDIDEKVLTPVESNDKLYDIFDYKFNNLIACNPIADFFILKICIKDGRYKIYKSSINNIGKVKGDIVIFIDPNKLFSLSSYEEQVYLYEKGQNNEL